MLVDGCQKSLFPPAAVPLRSYLVSLLGAYAFIFLAAINFIFITSLVGYYVSANRIWRSVSAHTINVTWCVSHSSRHDTLVISLCHPKSSRDLNITSALEVFRNGMRIALYKSTFYLLTYLLIFSFSKFKNHSVQQISAIL